MRVTVRAAEDRDRDTIDAFREKVRGGPYVAGHDERFDLRTLPAPIAEVGPSLRALRRGMRITAVDRGAVDRARTLKPEIPLVGADGIEIHDERRLERGR